MRGILGLTIVSVMNGTGVHDFGSDLGGNEEKVLILERMVFRAGARSNFIENIFN